MTEFSSIKQQSLNTIKIVFLIIAGLALPLFLMPLIKFTGYSEIVEEIAKAGVVLFLISKLPRFNSQILAGIAFGFLFGTSENLLYLNNIFQLNDFSILWQRFIWTMPMHIITVLIIILAELAGKSISQNFCRCDKKIYPHIQKLFSAWWIILGLLGAITLHISFNKIIILLL